MIGNRPASRATGPGWLVRCQPSRSARSSAVNLRSARWIRAAARFACLAAFRLRAFSRCTVAALSLSACRYRSTAAIVTAWRVRSGRNSTTSPALRVTTSLRRLSLPNWPPNGSTVTRLTGAGLSLTMFPALSRTGRLWEKVFNVRLLVGRRHSCKPHGSQRAPAPPQRQRIQPATGQAPGKRSPTHPRPGSSRHCAN